MERRLVYQNECIRGCDSLRSRYRSVGREYKHNLLPVESRVGDVGGHTSNPYTKNPLVKGLMERSGRFGPLDTSFIVRLVK